MEGLAARHALDVEALKAKMPNRYQRNSAPRILPLLPTFHIDKPTSGRDEMSALQSPPDGAFYRVP